MPDTARLERLVAEAISFSYRERRVLDSCSLRLHAGEFVAVAGPNGAGKTTLLRCLGGLLQPDSGVVRLEDGRDIRHWPPRARARRIAFLAQQPVSDFGFTVREIVQMGRAPYRSWFGVGLPTDEAIVERCLEHTDLTDLAERPVTRLSGGELRRVFLARALAQEPRILILDEPTAHLDLRHAVELYRLVDRLRREQNLSVMAATHDLNLVAPHADRVALMSQGRIVRDAPTREALEAGLLSHVFGMQVEVRPDGPGGTPWVLPGAA